MTYSIIAAWISECSIRNKKIESVYFAAEELQIRFLDRTLLRIILRKNDSFAYLEDSFAPLPASQQLWSQLNNAQVSDISLAEDDRILFMTMKHRDIYGQNSIYVLIAEFTPPKPNVIFARQNGGLEIIDALHKYTYADNPQRQILPKLVYQEPRTKFRVSCEEVTFPLILASIKDGGELLCDSVNEYLRLYYQHRVLAASENQKRESLRLAWERELKKARHKLQKQETELRDAEKLDHWLVCAETLKTNLSTLRKGQTSLGATNYFDPELGQIEIGLSPDLTPLQNLQVYVRKYQKARRGAQIIRQKVAGTKNEIEQIERVLRRVSAGEEFPLPGTGTLSGLGKKLDQHDRLLRLRLSEEFEIVIGRKARENDLITTQLARPHDWWFHTRIYHGSHILLRCFRKTNPGPELIQACCSLAAWYSKAKFSSNVPVDYTQVRFVRKPRKSAPGFVTYSSHQTVFAEPRDLRSVKAELLP